MYIKNINKTSEQDNTKMCSNVEENNTVWICNTEIDL